MKSAKMLTILVLALALMVCQAKIGNAAPMGTAFTYQGRLIDANEAADGLYDFQFSLYDDANTITSNRVGGDVNKPDVDVIDGYFTVELDFGSSVFDGDSVWLEIEARPGDSNDPNAFVTLSPRQEMTPVPYAFYAKNSSGLALPYAGSATGSGGPVLSITNTGTGSAIKGTGQNSYGVRGESSAAGSSGVYGINKSAGGYGVFGWSDSGTGVKGFTSGTGVAGQFQIANMDNSNVALEGKTNGPGTGVYGWATAYKGTNYGVRGRTESPDGYAGYFEGRIYASDRVGIGTISPATSLEVNGQVKITGGSPAVGKVLTSDADGLASWQTPSVIADSDWQVSGGDMYSIPSGNIGIGTTTPRGKLDVEGDGSNIYLDTWSAQVYIGDIDGDGDETLFTVDDDAGKFTFENGNVGIGITNPDEKLTVDGTIKSTTSAADGRGVYGRASNSGDVTNYGGYFTAAGSNGRGVYGEASNIGNVTNYGGIFTAAGSNGRGGYFEASGITGAGVYGYASNSGHVVNFGGYFRAAGSNGRGVYGHAFNSGDVTNYGGYFEASGSDGRGVYGKASYGGDQYNYGGYFESASRYGAGVYGEASHSYGGYGVYGKAGGTYSIGVYGKAMGSGYGVCGWGNAYDFFAAGPGINYGAPSSIRWKRDIRPIDEPLGKVVRLRGVYFNWDAEHGGEHDVGMIAEEVGEVLPEIVQYEEDGIYTSGMDYSKLTPLLVEAVKELKGENDRLKERVEALERTIHQLAKVKELEL